MSDPREQTYEEQYGPRKEFEAMPPKPKPEKGLPPLRWCGQCADIGFRWIVDGDGEPIEPCPRCSTLRGEVPTE